MLSRWWSARVVWTGGGAHPVLRHGGYSWPYFLHYYFVFYFLLRRLFVLLVCFSPLLKTVPSTCICGVYELHMFTLSFAPTLPSVSLNRESSV